MSPRLDSLVLCLIITITGTPLVSSLLAAGAVGGALRAVHSCRSDSEYPHGNICCLKCPAGEHVVSHCTAGGHRGRCEECQYGTFLEHSNGLERCFRCTQCRPDQVAVATCTASQDTGCQCRAGRFCSPDEACEWCRKCSSCAEGELLVRNCTPTSNSECKKVQPPKSDSSSTGINVAVAVLSLLAIVSGIVVITCLCRCYRKSGSGRSQITDQRPFGDGHAIGHRPLLVRSVAEENKTLCESLSSSASNSQHSLAGLAGLTCSPLLRGASPLTLPAPAARQEEQPFPLLVAVNGEESLRRCLDLFVLLDIDYHRRFFRSLGLDDNVIKSRDLVQYEDRVHELLNVWMEKTGSEASINHLLRPLLELDQRRTAEVIKEKAVESGHYRLDQP